MINVNTPPSQIRNRIIRSANAHVMSSRKRTRVELSADGARIGTAALLVSVGRPFFTDSTACVAAKLMAEQPDFLVTRPRALLSASVSAIDEAIDSLSCRAARAIVSKWRQARTGCWDRPALMRKDDLHQLISTIWFRKEGFEKRLREHQPPRGRQKRKRYNEATAEAPFDVLPLRPEESPDAQATVEDKKSSDMRLTVGDWIAFDNSIGGDNGEGDRHIYGAVVQEICPIKWSDTTYNRQLIECNVTWPFTARTRVCRLPLCRNEWAFLESFRLVNAPAKNYPQFSSSGQCLLSSIPCNQTITFS